jgi:hypothetical protein
MTYFATDGVQVEKNGSHICARTAEGSSPGKLTAACARLGAWAKIIDTIHEQRRALDLRIWRADPDDMDLEPDVHAWVVLSNALADYLEVKNQ